MNARDQLKLRALILQMLEGDIDSEEKSQLEEWLAFDFEARAFYFDIIDFNNLLQDVESLPQRLTPDNEEPWQWNTDLVNQLAEYEKRAPAVDIKPVAEPAEFDDAPIAGANQNKQQMSQVFWKRVALTSVAAAILLTLIIRFMPQRLPVGQMVAFKDVKWEVSQTSVDVGEIVYTTDESWILQQGIVTLHMDCGAEVYIEGPAVFSCQADNRLYMQRGRVCAYLPVKDTHFIIETPTARILDLGTEFGVYVNGDGASQMQVYEGETEFSTQSRHRGIQKQVFRRGMAGQVGVGDQQLRSSSFFPEAFVRYADGNRSTRDRWRCQSNLF